jgi:Holliday junction DNA helicase RuvA
MIAQLRGKVIAKEGSEIVMDVRGVGYRVFVLPQLCQRLTPGILLSLYTRLIVREDEMSLYGFATLQERRMFDLLTSVPGVGPKGAMNVLALVSPAELEAAIVQGDEQALTKVSGIGRRTAERIVVELKEKMVGGALAPATGARAQILDALVAMGYKVQEARAAVQRLPAKVDSMEEGLREALRALGSEKGEARQ